ncbi:hypothetical protein [Tautonia rosea]|uniref:hypothetical protein n=1 Tax=Tautonia rosea TaxID=2728037 RepID=UPI001474E5E2|nr:hypothetical protein [Tautonia rosea]
MSRTTVKQTIANRLNALLSTGPKTIEGKARSSQNARTHGLSKLGTRLSADMAEAIETRKAQWRNDYRPEGAAQEWFFERLVAESVRLDCCDARIVAARAEHAARASESWDDDRAAAIASLGARLAHQPERIQSQLLQSKHGVLWLLERWDEVRDSLTRHEGWTFETWNLALDLLGVPTFARDGSGPWDLDPEDKTEAPGLDLVAQATAALRDRLDAYLHARDERAQADAALGLDADEPPSIRLLERYAADARRQFSRNLNELRRLQSLASRPAPASAPPPPGPRPSRCTSAPPIDPDPRSAPDRPPAPIEAIADSSPLRNEAKPHGSSDRTDANAGFSPLRNEPVVTGQRAATLLGRPSISRTTLSASSPRENRRARRARAAAARRS